MRISKISFRNSFDNFTLNQGNKIREITPYNFSNIPATTNENKQNNLKKKIINTAAIIGAIGVSAFGIYKATKGRGITELSALQKAKKMDFQYIKNLAEGINKTYNINIKPEQLSSVMGKNELLYTLKTMKAENFAAYKEILNESGKVERIFDYDSFSNGIFKIDLHSHTNYSDGVGKVSEIMNNIVNYANSLKEKTGENFIFSITDHDSIGGTEEALRLIAGNPKKYRNLRFIPGVELSFAHKTDKGDVQISELLAHCINPYSKSTIDLVETLKIKRKNMIDDMIGDLAKNMPEIRFSKQETKGFFIEPNRELFKYGLHWRIYNYAQVKQRMSGLAKQWGKDPEHIYYEIMPQWHIFREHKCPESFESFMQNRMVDLTKTKSVNNKITEICQKYFPHTENNRVLASGERTFEEITEALSKEEGAVLGFAHPAFFAKHFNNPEPIITEMVENSNGLLKTTEKYHQGYFIPLQKGVISQELIDKTNKTIDKYNLLPLGGHDNHQKTVLI